MSNFLIPLLFKVFGRPRKGLIRGDFLETLERNATKLRDRRFLGDGTGKWLTYGECYELSGRVYAYLKKAGVGREDFVLISLPRGARPIVATWGVLRAGAAFVVVEDDLPADRIDYIRNDCACKVTIDEACWESIVKIPHLDGFEPRDDHSAAFAVYTSGTTGAPKGVLHEYGNIMRMLTSSPLPPFMKYVRFALCSPLNFVASANSIFLSAFGGTSVFVVPFGVMKDPAKLRTCLIDNKIMFAFLSPLFVKKMAPILSSLTFCMVGSEPANELYCDDFSIVNTYTMSEVGFFIALHLIDKSYANTPAGKPLFKLPIRLEGEDGAEVVPGEKGEIVVENPYVRGYINLPEKTAAAFKDGWYHTGDLGVWDDQGRLVVSGRLDDMAKVNGNRVEPGEIETVARDVLGLSWAAAKIFSSQEKSFVCLYYLDDAAMDAKDASAKMAEKLPYYMVPSFFVHIDEIPLTATGKFNRRALHAPVIDGDRAAFRAPENDVQRALCDAFEKALGVSNVGLDDDFARLGGDSLGAMDVVVSSGLEGLSVADVLKGMTPEGIAELYEARAGSENPDEVNALALGKSYPLTADQACTVELQLREPTSTMRSIHSLQKFDKDVLDMGRMAAAIDAAAHNHPALTTEIYRDGEGELRQRFSADILVPVKLERVSEAEFSEVQKTLVRPFGMIGEPLFRARVFETEEAGYVFVDVHHAVFDGASNGVFMQDVMAAYAGKELSKDFYPYVLEMAERSKGASGDGTGASYFEDRYGGVDWCRHLSIVGDAQGSAVGTSRVTSPATMQQLARIEKARGLSKNGFFTLATALALSAAQNASDVMLFWSFNGRTNALELSTVGNLRCYLPLALSFNGDITFEDLCASVNDQIAAGIAHCRESYLELNPEIQGAGITRVLYQGTLGNPPKVPGFLGAIPLGRGAAVSRAFVNLEVSEVGDDIALVMRYTEKSFSPKMIDRFERFVSRAVEVLAAHAFEPKVSASQLFKEISE